MHLIEVILFFLAKTFSITIAGIFIIILMIIVLYGISKIINIILND